MALVPITAAAAAGTNHLTSNALLCFCCPARLPCCSATSQIQPEPAAQTSRKSSQTSQIQATTQTSKRASQAKTREDPLTEQSSRRYISSQIQPEDAAQAATKLLQAKPPPKPTKQTSARFSQDKSKSLATSSQQSREEAEIKRMHSGCLHSLLAQSCQAGSSSQPILLNVVHSLRALAWNPGLCLKSAGCEWRMCGLTTGPCARVQFEDPLPSSLCASASVLMDACMGWPVRDLEPLPEGCRWRLRRLPEMAEGKVSPGSRTCTPSIHP